MATTPKPLQQRKPRPVLGRVLVRLDHCNPRRFLVRDPEKFARWRMLASTELGQWDGSHGIRIERFT